MTAVDQTRLAEMDRVYDQYGKPFEATHWGQYIAITGEGETIIGPTVLDVAQRAVATFGPGSFLFKIGDRAIGKVR